MKKLREHTYYIILLPVFFVLHAYIENYGAISPGEAIISAIIYTAGIALVAQLFRYVYRSKTKAGIATLAVAVFFFFLPALREFLGQYSFTAFIARLRVLLPACLLAFIIIFKYLRRSKKQHYGFTIFLNLLFIAFLLPDLGRLASIIISPDNYRLTVAGIPGNSKPCDTCSKPDIFLIIMDEYASSASLKEQYNFDNDLDSFLLAKNFSIQTKSRSNYNYTVFSLVSLFNMNYLEGIPPQRALEAQHHSNCLRLIESNEVTKRLARNGYELVNYSMFSMDDQSPKAKQDFATPGIGLITRRTAPEHLTLAWKFRGNENKGRMPDFENRSSYFSSNQNFYQLLMKAAARQEKPRFIYSHFVMPHTPFYYDRDGKINDLTDPSYYSLADTSDRFIQHYLDYVIYTNRKIREMINAIQSQNPQAMILLLGDHGFRPANAPAERLFENLNAVYYPNGDYSLLYDSLTLVNQFRVFFNQFFNEELPLLKDSTVFLTNIR